MKERKNKKNNRLGEEKNNNQGSLMRIIEYNKCSDIVIEFQDKYKTRVYTNYQAFNSGNVNNPYYPSAYGVGITGNKYPVSVNRKNIKEYRTWRDMLRRCFDEEYREKHPTYKDTTCCDDWLLYENFYEWLHKQENFDKWLNGKRWSIDKDIIIKGNKIYSPDTCLLVPHNVNSLFTKGDAMRNDLSIGVAKCSDGYMAHCHNTFKSKKSEYIGIYSTPKQAFQAYKKYKENIIKQIAQEEYNKGNIIEKCYDAMMEYKVEITD